MSKTLSFIDGLRAIGQSFKTAARKQDHISESRRAARSFRTALAERPDDVGLIRDYAGCLLTDPAGNRRRAARLLRRAARLAPNDAAVWAALGTAYRELGRLGDGLKCLRRAHTLDAASVEFLSQYADALIHAGRLRQAERVAREARFRAPRCGRVAELWVGVRYRVAKAAQLRRRDVPAVLPFAAPATATPTGTTARRDAGGHRPTPHYVRLRLPRRDTPDTLGA